MSKPHAIALLGEVAQLVRGVTYAKQDSSSEPASGLVPLLRATNIDRELNFTALVYVPESCVNADQYLFVGDSVIAASSGSLSVVGKSAILRREWNGTFGAFCYALRPKQTHIDPFYLGYFLQTSEYRSQVSRLAAGVNINNLRRQHLEQLDVPLVSKSEQHRIVEAIDSYFTRLHDAVASLERVQRNLKRYRASVLKAAVEGRLVPTEAESARAEGRDYEPASVLLERILAERRRRWEESESAKMKAQGKVPRGDGWKAKYEEPMAPDITDLPELPDGWCWSSVDQLAHLVRNGYSKKPQATGDVRILRISAVRPMKVDFADSKWLPESPNDYSYDLVQSGDLLFTRYNGTPALVGVAGLVKFVDRPTVHPDKLIKVRFIENDLDLRYLELATNAGQSRRHVESRMRTTAGQAGISGRDIKQIPIPLPPNGEQARISEVAELHLSVADEAASALSGSILRCTRLRQSILKWAFEGRLVDQDPTDEPASKLLERINAARASELVRSPNQRPRRKTRKGKAT